MTRCWTTAGTEWHGRLCTSSTDVQPPSPEPSSPGHGYCLSPWDDSFSGSLRDIRTLLVQSLILLLLAIPFGLQPTLVRVVLGARRFSRAIA